jgi:hypothetical protein
MPKKSIHLKNYKIMCLATFLANGNLSGFIGPHSHSIVTGISNTLKSTILNQMINYNADKNINSKDIVLGDFVNLLTGDCEIQKSDKFITKSGEFFFNGNRSDVQWDNIKQEIENGNITENCMIDDNTQLNNFLNTHFFKK